MKSTLVAATLLCIAPFAVAEPAPKLAVTHYDLEYRLDLKSERLQAQATLRIRNLAQQPARMIPLLLYRLLQVTEVREGDGGAGYTQNISVLTDEPTLQANVVRVRLRTPLAAGQERELRVAYSGHLLGYQEVMDYVRDRIDRDYTLLRNDSLAYPLVSEPSFGAMIRALQPGVDYRVRTTVPAGYEVACGNAHSERQESAGNATVTCTSLAPNDRIDVAVARFSVTEDRTAGLKIFSLPADGARAEQIMAEMKRAIGFYSDYLGVMPGYSGYTVIEIPDGWGSQASRGYILQTAAAFRDQERISELYHEIGHTWNAVPAADIQRSRFFDEAFASYFAFLAVREFGGEQAFAAAMQRARERFRSQVARNPASGTSPIAEYGLHELGGNSYTKGAWALHILHATVGEEAFRRTMRRLLAEHATQPVTFQDFLALSRKESGMDLERYAAEWFYGVESTELLLSDADWRTIASRYRPAPANATP